MNELECVVNLLFQSSLLAFATRQYRRMHYVFRLSHCSVYPHIRSSCQILLARYLMNGSNSFDKTDMEYSLSPPDDLI